ncbi:MAG: dTDP-4-dehydrorhamnose 3,5-epimerase family protein [Candidatus Acidiferrales bacterium]
MIDGVKVKQLRVIPDERGRLMEILRSDDELFVKFGQLYMTTAHPGVVKGWHYHKKQVDNFAVVKGMIKLVLYDGREGSSTRGEVNEFYMGIHNPQLVQIPALVLHGFKSVGAEEAIVLNCPTELYHHGDPDEFRVDPFSGEVPYDWAIKMR